MTFDNEKQKGLVLQLIEAANFTGKAIEEIHELKMAVLGFVRVPQANGDIVFRRIMEES